MIVTEANVAIFAVGDGFAVADEDETGGGPKSCLLLRSLNWDIINGQWFSSVEKKRIKHAEVLVPNLLPIDEIQGIYVKTPIMVQAVNAVIEECGLTGRIPSAVSRPDLYF